MKEVWLKRETDGEEYNLKWITGGVWLEREPEGEEEELGLIRTWW